MAEKKKTKKATKKSVKKIKLSFMPIASGAKQISFRLRGKSYEEKDGRRTQVSIPLIEGLPEVLTVKRDEIIEVDKKQLDELRKLGFVETDEEYKKRQAFIDNLDNQHPDKLSFAQLSGENGDLLTMRDSQYKIYMDKLVIV